MRKLITMLIRLSELPRGPLVAISAVTIVLNFWQASDFGENSLGANRQLSVLGLILSLLPLLPVAVKDWNLWQFFPPQYNGINRAMRRVTHSYATRDCFYIGVDGRIRIDAAKFLRQNGALIQNLSFVGRNRDLQKISGRINAEAFSGTRYGLGAGNKTERNASLAEANPLTLALLKDGAGGYCGLSAVLPLSKGVVHRYSVGAISDNDLTGEMLARPAEPVSAIILFLIAHSRELHHRSESLQPHTLALLIETCVLQVILQALAAREKERFLVIAANSDRKLRELFDRLHLRQRPDFKLADQQLVFANEIILKGMADARKYLADEHPDLFALTQ